MAQKRKDPSGDPTGGKHIDVLRMRSNRYDQSRDWRPATPKGKVTFRKRVKSEVPFPGQKSDDMYK